MKNVKLPQPVALLFLRWGAGIVFLYHGYPKLAHAEQWTHAFVQMGFPSWFAYIAGFLETVGGVLLVFGLATRVSALLLAAEMAVAVLRVDLPSGSILQVDNYQLSLLLAAGALVLASLGPGEISLDYLNSFVRSRRAARPGIKPQAHIP